MVMFENTKITYQCMVVLKSRGQVSNSCGNFMKPGSQSGIYRDSNTEMRK